jgi:hypothetical protein
MRPWIVYWSIQYKHASRKASLVLSSLTLFPPPHSLSKLFFSWVDAGLCALVFLLGTGKQRKMDLSLYICSSMLYNHCSQQRWFTFIVLLAGVYRGYGTNSCQASSTSWSLSGHPTICTLGLSAPRLPYPLNPISMVKVSQSPVDGGRGFYLWLFHF